MFTYEAATPGGDVSPDILLILNETFCDLGDYASICPDIDYLQAFYNIENATYGHAVVPDIGGGTNDTEFELLTSHSMHLINASAPFTYLDLSQISANHVRYLNSLGYQTTAMHCCPASNYARNKAYPALGFQRSILGKESFAYYDRVGEREWLDSGNYLDLIEAYENNCAETGKPQFFYLLTFQNHGGYDSNPDELDTVHTTSDFGELNDEINEYCSSLRSQPKHFMI